MRILFRLDFGPFVGLGHLARCVALAKEFQKNGHEVFFVSRFPKNSQMEHRNPELLGSIPLIDLTPFPQNRNASVSTWLGVSEKSDAEETQQVARSVNADLLVLDHYGAKSAWVSSWNSAAPILQISDEEANLNVDYILDYGFDASIGKHIRALNSGALLLAGPEFAPVSSKYEWFGYPTSERRSGRPQILVSLGGAATPESWRQVFGALEPNMESSDYVFVGSENALDQFANTGDRLRLEHSSSGLINELKQTDIAIVSAGVSMYELLASGKPGIVLATAANQLHAFQAGRKLKAFEAFHFDAFVASNAIAPVIDQLCASDRSLAWLRSRSLVDHFGTLRLLLSLGLQPKDHFELRPFETADLPFLLRLVNQGSVVSSSFSLSAVAPKEHWEWSQTIGTRRRIWIFEVSGLPIGQCRLDSEGNGYILSYSIEELFQGRGYSKLMLKALIREIGEDAILIAKVRPENIASQKVLKHCNFTVTYSSELYMQLEKRGSGV